MLLNCLFVYWRSSHPCMISSSVGNSDGDFLPGVACFSPPPLLYLLFAFPISLSSLRVTLIMPPQDIAVYLLPSFCILKTLCVHQNEMLFVRNRGETTARHWGYSMGDTAQELVLFPYILPTSRVVKFAFCMPTHGYLEAKKSFSPLMLLLKSFLKCVNFSRNLTTIKETAATGLLVTQRLPPQPTRQNPTAHLDDRIQNWKL